MIYTESLPTGPELFTPLTDFDGDFYNVLFAIPLNILNKTEKALMRILAFHKYRGGACYPSHQQIAEKLGCTKRNVQIVLKRLDDKGFIQRIIPENWKRRWWNWRNNYEFRWHPAYEEVGGRLKKSKISSRISSRSTDPTFIRDKENKILHPAAPDKMPIENSKEQTARYRQQMDLLCSKISMRTQPAGSRFNASAFRFSQAKVYGPEAAKKALEAILERLESIRDDSIIKVMEIWGYGVSLLKTQAVMNGKTCSADDILGEGYKPPDKMPGSVAAMLPGLFKSF